MKTEKRMAGSIHFEPSLVMEVRRGFRCCGIPNPDGLAQCPKCGAAAVPPETLYAEQTVATLPIGARAMFWVAKLLLSLARKIEGER